MSKTAIFLLLLLIPTQLHLEVLIKAKINFEKSNLLIVWNVGQGQWVTFKEQHECLHYDMGGEFSRVPFQVMKFCSKVQNKIYFSHWDSDHISFANQFANLISQTCIAAMPGGPPPSDSKFANLDKLQKCISPHIASLIWQPLISLREKKMTSNDHSKIYLYKTILIPGDSPKKQEKKWSSLVSNRKITGLILGHHGSRSSTSEYLLKSLSHLQWVVASARFNRYGHPHPEVIARLQKRKIPILKTEEWGSLFFVLKN